MADSFPPELIEILRRACGALGSYRDRVVLTGGLVPFVYRHHPGFDARLPLPPLGTKDADMALPIPLEVADGRSLLRCLVDGGLVPEVGRGLDGEDSVTRFYLPDHRNPDDPYLEFLVADPGRRHHRIEGRPQPDLRAHTVRFLPLLTHTTWDIEVPGIGTIKVPHPAGYIAQKTRISDRRGPKWAKDQGDVVLVAWAFRSMWNEIATAWREIGGAHPQGKWMADSLTVLRRLYATPDAEGCFAVTDIYRNRTDVAIPREAFHQVMQGLVEHLDGAS